MIGIDRRAPIQISNRLQVWRRRRKPIAIPFAALI
jgi:hypothetical protein